jgi:hypothetical protein
MSDCDHVMERKQFWDECVKCGARWNPELGWGVPMNTNKGPRPPVPRQGMRNE